MNRELHRADVVLCPSDFVRDTMVCNGVAASKCFINPFGVDTEVFQSSEATPEVPRFICVGTICLRKGHQYLFRAFETVKKQFPTAELICVGRYKTDFRKERLLGFYADKLAMTPDRLNDIVKRATGVTAGHLIRQRVLTEAKRQLVFTSQPIHEIAYDLAFSDPSHFARFFRKQTGTTPHEFREGRGG